VAKPLTPYQALVETAQAAKAAGGYDIIATVDTFTVVCSCGRVTFRGYNGVRWSVACPFNHAEGCRAAAALDRMAQAAVEYVAP
jgi:hypothetical protein